MRTRVLPREEWAKAEAATTPFLPLVNESDRRVVAVEDDDGRLLGCVNVLRVTHYESFWVNPESRGGGATRSLLRGAAEIASAEFGDEWVFVNLADPEMKSYVKRLGGRELPVATYVLPLTKE